MTLASRILALALLPLAGLTATARAQTCGQIPFDLGNQAMFEVALGNNDSGVVVGRLGYDFDEHYSDAFIWKQGVVTLLPGLAGTRTSAVAINGGGQVIGHSQDINGSTRAVTWVNGVRKRLPDLNPSLPQSKASGINVTGRIVGGSLDSEGRWHAVRWANGKIVDLNPAIGAVSSFATAINRKGQIVGWAVLDESVDYYTAFMYEAGAVQFLPDLGGHIEMTPAAINDAGQIVGRGRAASRAYRAFLWSEGVMKDLGSLNGAYSWATGINNSGQVVGTTSTSVGNRAFSWKNGVMTELGTSDSTWPRPTSEGNAINNKGQILGVTGDDRSSWRWKRDC